MASIGIGSLAKKGIGNVSASGNAAMLASFASKMKSDLPAIGTDSKITSQSPAPAAEPAAGYTPASYIDKAVDSSLSKFVKNLRSNEPIYRFADGSRFLIEFSWGMYGNIDIRTILKRTADNKVYGISSDLHETELNALASIPETFNHFVVDFKTDSTAYGVPNKADLWSDLNDADVSNPGLVIGVLDYGIPKFTGSKFVLTLYDTDESIMEKFIKPWMWINSNPRNIFNLEDAEQTKVLNPQLTDNKLSATIVVKQFSKETDIGSTVPPIKQIIYTGVFPVSMTLPSYSHTGSSSIQTRDVSFLYSRSYIV